MFESNKTILQLLKSKDQYEKLRGVINNKLMDYEVRRVINTLDAYWRNYPEHTVAQPDVLLNELLLNHDDLGDDQIRMYKSMVDIMMEDPDAESAKGIVRTLRTFDFADEMAKAEERFHTGADIDLFQTVKDLCQRYERDISRDLNIDYIRTSIEEILEEEANGHRFHWGLSCLNGSMPVLRTGMQVIVAARPGKGKTSLCAFNAVAFAPEVPDDRPIFWLNNEGRGHILKATTYRAALKTDREGLIELGAIRAAEGYSRVVGAADRIRIYDVHGRDYKFLERLIDDHRPSVVFFDMLDNVHGFGDAARTDLRLEQVYQWARESAVIYDFLSIPTSQISVEGEGLAWCDQSMLKDSKTAKQGACDAIITMGAKNGPEWVNSRFMYIPKSKQQPLRGNRVDCCREVHFDGARCQFSEVAPADSDIPV